MSLNKSLKYTFISLLLLSLSFNVYFFTRWINRYRRETADQDLRFAKDISYKEGYASLRKKLQEEHPEMLTNKKVMLIYFWDSLLFDEFRSRSMPDMDSLAEALGKEGINYLFMTEMEKDASEQFLKRQNLHFKNFEILYEMNDFISSVYMEKGPKWKRIGSKDTSVDPEMRRMKMKPGYLIIDETGNVLFSGYKFFRPVYDTAFVNKLKKYSSRKKIKILN
jgi:hypothetical protein